MTDPDEHTPIPRLLPERVARLEWHHEQQKKEQAAMRSDLSEVAKELRGVAESVRSLVERRRFFDKVVLACVTAAAIGLLGFLMRLSWWVQSAKLP